MLKMRHTNCYRNIMLAGLSAFVLLSGAVSLSALPADRYAASSRLSSGKWVKIRVADEGMQLLTVEQLKNMGFSDPAKVNVYGYGGRRLPETLGAATPDDLPMQTVARTSRGILFFGAGTVRWELSGVTPVRVHNPYASASYYFLSDVETEGTAGAAYDTAFGTDDTVLTAVPYTQLHELESFSAGMSGGDLFGEDFRSKTSQDFAFDMPDAVDDSADFFVRFGAKTSALSKVALVADGQDVGSAEIRPISDNDTYICVMPLSGSAPIADGKSSITVRYEPAGVVTNARLDYITATYMRSLRLHDGQIHFRYNCPAAEPVVFSVGGCSDSAVVWDVTEPSDPRPVEYTLSDGRAMFAPAAPGLREYVVFEPAAVVAATPVSAGNVAVQDIHAMETPDMLIVSPKEYVAQAERLAAMHRDTDGMVVHVLQPEAIYNEFSSGTPDVTAFRRLLKMWYDRGRDPETGARLQQCLLFGRAAYDQRQLSEGMRNTYPRVLTWQTVMEGTSVSTITETGSYLSDNYIGMLEDTENFNIDKGVMSIGVGRMPVKNVTEARLMVDKTVRYVSEPTLGAWRNNVMLLGDDGDSGTHLRQSEGTYSRYMAGGNGSSFLYSRLYVDAFPLGAGSTTRSYPALREKMFRLLDEGVGLWQYIGHANPTSWTAENIWTYSDLTSMTNRNWPVLYTASCEFIRFDSDAISGAELMWLHPDSGIIAAVAANRKVYIGPNEYMSNGFAANYFKRDADGGPRRLGDIYKSAINEVGDESNKHRFAIMGDPALKILSPTYSARIDEIDGVQVDGMADAADWPVVPGGSKISLKGTVLDKDGQPATDFDGTLVATLYDAEKVVTTFGRDGVKDDPGKVMNYNDRTNRLFSGSVKVHSGKWELTVPVSEDIENNYSPARFTLYAAASDGREANGDFANFYIYGWDEDGDTDVTAPEILSMYLNSAAFKSGAKVLPDPVFMATVRDDSGINISSGGVGRQMTVTVDTRKVYSNVSDYFTTDPDDVFTGHVNYPLEGLAAGRHTLEFIVWDNAGNSSRDQFEFEIAERTDLPEIDIYCDANPAVSSVTFYVTSPDSSGGGIIDVFDLSGRKVWSSNEQGGAGMMSATWDLTDVSGSRVPRGIYLYRATVTGADGKEKRATRKLAVGNP